MRMRRAFCAAGLLCGIGLGPLTFSAGCGGSATTGMRGEASEKLKAQVAERGKKLKAFYRARKAETEAKKGRSRN
jgi:hypothetical protein